MWISIASKLVPGIIKTGMSIASNRRKTRELESVAEMKHAERMASGELEYKKNTSFYSVFVSYKMNLSPEQLWV